MSLAKSILRIVEIMWHEAYPAADAMKKFPKDYIHFTGIEKIGINPQKKHKDPNGVYFYPCKWLLDPDNWGGFQYGLVKEFFYIARIKTRGDGVVNLGKITQNDVEDLADKNGWLPFLLRARNRPTIFFKDSPIPKRSRRRPGALLYGVADMLVNDSEKLEDMLEVPEKLRGEKWTWGAVFKDIKVMIDPGYGIIAEGEPNQVLVIDPRYYEVLYKGSNKAKDSGVSTGQAIIKELGGREVGISNRIVIGTFDYEGAPIEGRFNMGYSKVTLVFYKNKRKIEHELRVDIDFDRPRSYEVSSAIYAIKRFLGEVSPEPVPEKETKGWTGPELKEAAERVFSDNKEFKRGYAYNEGEQWISVSNNGFISGGFKYFGIVSVGPEGLLKFMYQDRRDEGDFEYTKEGITKEGFEEVLTDFLSRFGEYLEKTFGDTEKWKKLLDDTELQGLMNVKDPKNAALWYYARFMGIVWPYK